MPVHKGRLKEADYTKVQMNYVFLSRELDGKFLVDEMFAANVFTDDDIEEIQSQDSREKRTGIFLQKLLHSGPGPAFDVFLRTLGIHYPHVADKLKEKLSEEEGERSEDNPTDENPPKRQQFDEQVDTYIRLPQGSEQDWLECQKYPGHKSLIPVKNFDASHLPAHFKLPEVVEYVEVLAEQTVLTKNDFISPSRPEGYPHKVFQGTDTKICGTGRVWRVMRNFSQLDDDTCPCDVCKSSSSPVRQWGQFIVVTSKSLVFNDEECVNTKCILWYDEPQAQFKPALTGVRLITSDIINNYSEILCVTHNKVVSEKLEAIFRKNEDLSMKLARSCYQIRPKEHLIITISHPHWGSKHVTVEGVWFEGDNDRSGAPYTMKNDVQTTARCSGSGGSPVLLLNHMMSCCTINSFNFLSRSDHKMWSL